MSAEALLVELIARHDEGAVLTARPYMPDSSGDVLRWVLEIDGAELSDMDVRTGPDPERPDVMVMILVRGDDEIELVRWHEDEENRYALKGGASYLPPGVASARWTLGGLRRHLRRPVA